MKKYLIECDLEFCSSHSMSEVGFSGGNNYKLDEGIKTACPMGLPNTQIEIVASGSPTFKVKVDSFDLLELERQVQYLAKLTSYLSFVIAKTECNGHYGTPFIKIKYETFHSTPIEVSHHEIIENRFALESVVGISERISLAMNVSVRFSNENVRRISHHELLTYYYNGLKAESEKSKFFHWFLIIEYLEGCARYKEMFPDGTLFSEQEKVQIKALADTLSVGKKSVLLSLLTRTSEYRNSKLLQFISALGILNLEFMGRTISVTIDSVSRITSVRNKLVHKGSEFPADTLWTTLFPLVSQVVERAIETPDCLERS